MQENRNEMNKKGDVNWVLITMAIALGLLVLLIILGYKAYTEGTSILPF